MIGSHRHFGGLAIAFALIAACTLEDVDFANKTCPCGGNYVCDTSRNLCVEPQNIVVNPDGGPGPSGDGGAGCRGDACPCTQDADCTDPDRRSCSPSKICVECVATNDNCRAGTFCNSSNQCILGCKQESDCTISPLSPHCDTARHQCVACRTIADCTNADQCSPSGECVEGCDPGQGKLCSGTKQCCNKLCIDTSTDPLNCGACNVACSTENSTPACGGGTCSWTCANGFAHCSGANTGCETNVRGDALNCSACGQDCSATITHATGPVCNASVCGYTSCEAWFMDNDKDTQNGCETPCGASKNAPCCPGGLCNSGLTCRGNKCN
jgi:hypothetical protein